MPLKVYGFDETLRFSFVYIYARGYLLSIFDQMSLAFANILFVNIPCDIYLSVSFSYDGCASSGCPLSVDLLLSAHGCSSVTIYYSYSSWIPLFVIPLFCFIGLADWLVLLSWFFSCV